MKKRYAAPLLFIVLATGAVFAASDLTDGEIRKVDKNTGTVAIKHGEIRNLNMSAMTMVFQAKDKSLLDKVKAGDKIRFRAESENGKLLVTDIQKVK
jgi:Cu(I)/Ag(I) efflux system periplasmic protein CusF